MTTTLKNYHGNDIATEMASILTDEKFSNLFKKASFEKTAMTLDDVEAVLKSAKDPNAAWNELLPGIKVQEDLEPGFYEKALAIYRQIPTKKTSLPEGPGYVPGSTEIKVQHVDDPQVAVAMDFTIKQLNKLASALDVAGFSGLSEYIDLTSTHIASERSLIATAKKKEEKLPSFKECSKVLKEDKKASDAFKKAYDEAKKEAKEEKMKKKEAEEYAMKAAMKKFPKKYLKELK